MVDVRLPSSVELLEPATPRLPVSVQDVFPAATRVMPSGVRPHVSAFLDFFRQADAIADDPALEREEKLSRLDAMEQVLLSGEAGGTGPLSAKGLWISLGETGIPPLFARQVLQAFRRDARNLPVNVWADVIAYCRCGAAPIGRFLLALHGEGSRPAGASDALCSALRILHNLQNCRDDWVQLGRCNLPLAWFEESRVSPERLVERKCDVRVREIFDRMLDRVDELLDHAALLPGLVHHRRLRLETSLLLAHARALACRLRRRDPLSRRVRLPMHSRMLAVLGGFALALGNS